MTPEERLFRTAKEITLELKLGKEGLWYVTSPELPGLLVTGKTFELAIGAVPMAIVEIIAALANAVLSNRGDNKS